MPNYIQNNKRKKLFNSTIPTSSPKVLTPQQVLLNAKQAAEEQDIDQRNKYYIRNNMPIPKEPVDTYEQYKERIAQKEIDRQNSPLTKIGNELESGAQFISGTLGNAGMNLPFDMLRAAGVKIPVNAWMPSAFSNVDTSKNLKQNISELFINSVMGAAALATDGIMNAGVSVLANRGAPKLAQGMLSTAPTRVSSPQVAKNTNWNGINQFEYDVKKGIADLKNKLNQSVSDTWRNSKIGEKIQDLQEGRHNLNMLNSSDRYWVSKLEYPYGNTEKVNDIPLIRMSPQKKAFTEESKKWHDKFTSAAYNKIRQLEDKRERVNSFLERNSLNWKDHPALDLPITLENWKNNQSVFTELKPFMEFSEFDGSPNNVFAGDQWGVKSFRDLINQYNKRTLVAPQSMRDNYKVWMDNINNELRQKSGYDFKVGGSALHFIKGRTNMIPGDIDRYVMGDNPLEKFVYWGDYKFGNIGFIGNTNQPGIKQVHKAIQDPIGLRNDNWSLVKKAMNRKHIDYNDNNLYKIDPNKIDMDVATMTDAILSNKGKHIARSYKIYANPNTKLEDLQRATNVRLQGLSGRPLVFPNFNVNDFGANMKYLSTVAPELSNQERRTLAGSPERMLDLLKNDYIDFTVGTRYLSEYGEPSKSSKSIKDIIKYLHSTKGTGGQVYSEGSGILDVYFGKGNTNTYYIGNDQRKSFGVTAQSHINWPENIKNPTAMDFYNNVNNLQSGVRNVANDIMTFPYNEEIGRGVGNVLNVNQGGLSSFVPRVRNIRRYEDYYENPYKKIDLPTVFKGNKATEIFNDKISKLRYISNKGFSEAVKGNENSVYVNEEYPRRRVRKVARKRSNGWMDSFETDDNIYNFPIFRPLSLEKTSKYTRNVYPNEWYTGFVNSAEGYKHFVDDVIKKAKKAGVATSIIGPTIYGASKLKQNLDKYTEENRKFLDELNHDIYNNYLKANPDKSISYEDWYENKTKIEENLGKEIHKSRKINNKPAIDSIRQILKTYSY